MAFSLTRAAGSASSGTLEIHWAIEDPFEKREVPCFVSACFKTSQLVYTGPAEENDRFIVFENNLFDIFRDQTKET